MISHIVGHQCDKSTPLEFHTKILLHKYFFEYNDNLINPNKYFSDLEAYDYGHSNLSHVRNPNLMSQSVHPAITDSSHPLFMTSSHVTINPDNQAQMVANTEQLVEPVDDEVCFMLFVFIVLLNFLRIILNYVHVSETEYKKLFDVYCVLWKLQKSTEHWHQFCTQWISIVCTVIYVYVFRLVYDLLRLVIWRIWEYRLVYIELKMKIGFYDMRSGQYAQNVFISSISLTLLPLKHSGLCAWDYIALNIRNMYVLRLNAQ